MNEEKQSGGLGFGTILFLIFLTLKLSGLGVVATWSWWWIFSPIWITLVLAILLAVFEVFSRN
jgi:hypothetical protein